MSAGECAGRQVLIVDDELALREDLSDILYHVGYHVATAANGRKALEYLRTHEKPGLILLDLLMPVMNGWEFQAALAQEPDLAGIPVVLLSAVDDVHRQTPQLAAEGYLRKPFDTGTLLEIVRAYCGDPHRAAA